MDKTLQSNYLSGKAVKKAMNICVLFMLAAMPAVAQEKITVKDAKEISYQAAQTVKSLPLLLNFITDPNNTPSELNSTIGESYKPSRNRIFFNKDVIVEDDIDPAANLGSTTDVPVDKYLNNLDVYYAKSTDATIKFDNVVTSGIKKKDYLYLNVKFDSEFTGKNKIKNAGYSPRQRQAVVRLSQTNNKWEALVVGIGFYDPTKPIDSKENDIQLYSDTSSTATTVSQEEAAKEIDSFKLSREEEEKNKQALFDEYITLATTYINNHQYKEALELYDKAKNLKSFVPSLDKKILDAKKLAAEYTYDNFKNRGDKAKGERRYDLAIQHYQQALILKPTASAVINAEISPLTKQMSIVAFPNNKVASGLFEQAIDECDKILRDNKKIKDKFPELYYIKGKAYEGLAEQKPGDAKSLTEKALENYNLAIQYFPNYLDARTTRSNFFVKYRNDYASAISDYDVLIINALDESPEKPGLLVTRAKLKDKVQNFNSAVDDYNKAISLNQTTPSLYFDRGELQYRLNKYDEAQKNFDIALKLDPKYRSAYYYRGLNYVALKNNNSAGADFIEAEKLVFEPAQLKKVDSISNNFFVAGEELLAKHDFANADSAYNNAIKIRNCNALAWHGKGEIRLRTAQELGKNIAAAKPKYLESIELNDKAIVCKPDFSDAHYKRGLANNAIANYDEALKSYSDAVKSDTQNAQAYVQRGNTYQTLKKYGKAADDYVQALLILKANYEVARKGSNDATTKAILTDMSHVQQLNGEALYYNNDDSNALLALDQSLDYDQTNAEALYYRGLVYARQNNLGKAFKDYNAAIKFKPHYKYYYANGTANYIDRNYELAINNYSDAISLDTAATVKNRYYLRGMSYFKNKMIADALKDFSQHEKVGTAGADSSFYADFGLTKLYAGQDTSAIRYLNKAIAVKAADAKALYSLGCAYAKMGQNDKALEYMEKAFATRQLIKDDIKLAENTFLEGLYKVKPAKTKYNQLKKLYIDN